MNEEKDNLNISEGDIKIRCNCKEVTLKMKKYNPNAIIPKYAHEGDAGFDFTAIINEKDTMGNWTNTVMVSPGEKYIVKTGISMAIPVGYEVQVRPRSGLAYKHGITVINAPGTIDCVPVGTKIATPAGNVNVENLYKNKDACVYSFNEETQDIEEDIVEDMWIVKDLELLEIETEDGIVKIPTEKELYTQNGWKKARDLTISDEILSFT